MPGSEENPMQPAQKLCGARTRAGQQCKARAMPNGRCRMHGGPSTGPRTPEGLARLRAARTRTGLHTADMVALRRMFAALRREARSALSDEVAGTAERKSLPGRHCGLHASTSRAPRCCRMGARSPDEET
jgi:hypothetical protein